MNRVTPIPGMLPAGLCLLVFLLLSGCSGTPTKPTPATGNARYHEPPSSASDPRKLTIARAMLGKPYRFGGASPRGFDCSGLVYYAFNRAGIDVPRTTTEQYRQSVPITPGKARPGDLVFFKLTAQRVSHVGIYTGNGRFIHAPSRGKPVGYASLANAYWQQRVVGYRRFD